MLSKRKIQALLIGIALALAAAEGLARKVQSVERHLPRTPNLRISLYPERGQLFGIKGESRHTTSSMGLRGPEDDPENQLRILCVGGSTTACEYLDDAETWPQLLGQILKETQTWVGNAGLSGHRAIDHVTLLGKLLDEIQSLDAVIVLAGINDLAVAAEAREGLQQQVNPTSASQLQRVFHAEPQTFALWPLSSTGIHSWLQSTKARRWEAASLEDPTAGSYQKRRQVRRDHLPASAPLPSLEEALRIYEAHLTWICQSVKRRGMQPVLLTQPVLWGAPQEVLDERCWFGWTGALPWKDPSGYIPLEEMAQGMHAFNRRTRSVAAREQALLVDLDHLSGKSALFYDDCHFTEAGAQAVAEALADSLRLGAPGLFNP